MATPTATDACAPRSKSRIAMPHAAARIAGALNAMRSVFDASHPCATSATAAPVRTASRTYVSRVRSGPLRPIGAMKRRPIASGTNALHGTSAGPR